MAAEGGQVIRRDRSSRRLAVVVVVQNVLVVACLIVTSYVYWEVRKEPVLEKPVHIQVDSVSDIKNINGSLELDLVLSNYRMSRHGNWILVNCTGPYLAYLEVCYTSLNNEGSRGVLELRLREDAALLSSFTLQATNEICRGLHNTTYLKEGQEVGVQLILSPGFKIKNVTLGFSFLWRC